MPASLPVPVRQTTLAELALVGIAAVWGLTFTMVQDAIAILPTLAFLAYRFAGATLLVAPIFWKRVRALPREGWSAGLVMGAFLTAGYIAWRIMRGTHPVPACRAGIDLSGAPSVAP